MAKKHEKETVPPRDGLDNTGTQGKDSLSDDAFTGSSNKPQEDPDNDESGTGSSSKDFHDASEEKNSGSGDA